VSSPRARLLDSRCGRALKCDCGVPMESADCVERQVALSSPPPPLPQAPPEPGGTNTSASCRRTARTWWSGTLRLVRARQLLPLLLCQLCHHGSIWKDALAAVPVKHLPGCQPLWHDRVRQGTKHHRQASAGPHLTTLSKQAVQFMGAALLTGSMSCSSNSL
jgi:hypothetical protein